MLTRAKWKFQTERRWRLAIAVALCLAFGGCKSCAEEDTPPPPEEQTPKQEENTPASPTITAPLPAKCAVTDGLHLFSLKGEDLGLPTPSPTLSANIAGHVGGAIRAATPVNGQVIWAEGVMLKGADWQRSVGALVNDLAVLTDGTTTRLAVAHAQGITIFPVTADAGGAIGEAASTINHFGEVTRLAAVAAGSADIPSEAIPDEIALSLNAPPPSAAAAEPNPAALFFTTADGDAYRLEGYCVTQLYDAEANLQGTRPFKAIGVAGDARHAIVLAETIAPIPTEHFAAVRATLAAVRANVPGLGRETARRLLPRLLHLARDTWATQTLVQIDLAGRKSAAFWPSPTGLDDALINDVAMANGQFMIHGAFFSRDGLEDLYPKETDRLGLFGQMAASFNPKGGASDATKTGAWQVGLVAVPAATPKSQANLLALPAADGAALPPFLGALASDGRSVAVRGPFGYLALMGPEAPSPHLHTIALGEQMPRRATMEPGGNRIATALLGRGKLPTAAETIVIDGKSATVNAFPNTPTHIERAKGDLVAYIAADESAYGLMDAKTFTEQTTLPITTAQLDKLQLTTTARHLDLFTANGLNYLVAGLSFAGGTGPKPIQAGSIAVHALGTTGSTFQQKAIFSLNVSAEGQGSLLSEVPFLPGEARRIADLRVIAPLPPTGEVIIAVLLEAAQGNERSYRVIHLRYSLKTPALTLAFQSPLRHVEDLPADAPAEFIWDYAATGFFGAAYLTNLVLSDGLYETVYSSFAAAAPAGSLPLTSALLNRYTPAGPTL
ncbi:MAG: hypothetical protein HY543_07875, partial [Deltaproteobacteria bacterium]|nr:hypothetical protein [Deltaproteobacteria bacterium]